MNPINTQHAHRLVFMIDNRVPKENMDKWKDFKLKCEDGEYNPSTSGSNKYILERMKESCKLKKNQDLPYLKRSEGGLGGDNNIENKQIRFRDYRLWTKLPKHLDNDIIMDQITNGNKELWTYEELDDIIYGFIKIANDIVGSDCIRGFMELKHNNCYLFWNLKGSKM